MATAAACCSVTLALAGAGATSRVVEQACRQQWSNEFLFEYVEVDCHSSAADATLMVDGGAPACQPLKYWKGLKPSSGVCLHSGNRQN